MVLLSIGCDAKTLRPAVPVSQILKPNVLKYGVHSVGMRMAWSTMACNASHFSCQKSGWTKIVLLSTPHWDTCARIGASVTHKDLLVMIVWLFQDCAIRTNSYNVKVSTWFFSNTDRISVRCHRYICCGAGSSNILWHATFTPLLRKWRDLC